MRLLLHTDSPLLYSGLARCGRELAKRFYEKTILNAQSGVEKQFELYYAGWHYSNKHYNLPYFLYPLQKGSEDEHKQFSDILSDCSPDIILSIGDIWDFHRVYNVVREYKENNSSAKWIVWLTIDGEHLHPAWKEVLNYADDVNVFSYFGQRELLKFSGIKANMIYPGVDGNVFRKIDSKIKENTLPFNLESSFLIIDVNQNTDRKNIPIMLEAFRDFAKDKDDVFLLLITDPHDPFGYDLWGFVNDLDIRKKVAITKEAGPVKGMTDAQLNLIYNLASVSVNTSIGEGLSLPTIEAMAVGTPVLGTDYAAMSELIDQGGGAKLKVAGYLYGFSGVKRALVSRDDIVVQLNSLYEDFKGDRKVKEYISQKSRRFANMLTWDKTAYYLMQRIESVSQEKKYDFVRESVKIKEINPLVVIPSWKTNCGIAEYTKSLVDSFQNKNQNVDVFSSYTYKEIPKIIEERGHNLVHIQHEYSFFKSKDELNKLLEKLREMRIKIILTLHTFVPGMLSYNSVLLTWLDSLIVHSEMFKVKIEEQLNKTGNIQSFKNCSIDVIPMGCGDKHNLIPEIVEETKHNLGIDRRHPIIGSFGFLRDQKGFYDFLLCVKELRKEYPNILALLVCPKHEFGSKTYDDAFFNFVERQGLSDCTLMIREYLLEKKLLDVLQCADLFVLNYHDSPIGGGISAAVKTLFRVQRPIIVNDSIAFCDLKDEVMKIVSVNYGSLIDPIRKVLSDKKLSDDLVISANRYIESNNWEKTAQRHLDLYSR